MQDKKYGLILTLDYEIHGNGSGNFYDWVYLPTNKILDVCDKFGAKLTIMAEMGHYWAMKRYTEIFDRDIKLFENQLKDAVLRGHDVQLHLHPQWIDAKYKDGFWDLDFSINSIQRLCYNYEESLYFLRKGKQELEDLLKPVNSDYECIGFRAGFFQIQPSNLITKALKDAGFVSDTSVAKGIISNDKYHKIDFTHAFSKYYPWFIDSDDICRECEIDSICEFPILSDSTRVPHKLCRFLRKNNQAKLITNFIRKGNGNQYKSMVVDGKTSAGLVKKILGIFHKRYYYLDFCLNDWKQIYRTINAVMKKKKNKNIQFIPILLIGHSKDFMLSNSLSLLLKKVHANPEIDFITYLNGIKLFNSK